MVARRTFNAVYFADTEWNITWVNEGFTRMSGFLPEEALGRRPSHLLHSPLADPATPHTIDRQVADGNRAQIQVLQRSKQGKDYWVDLEVMPIRDSRGHVTGYLSVQSDITEEVQAKAALVLEKERAENILSATNVGTWDSNLQTGEQRWNDRWAAMLGFAREEVVPDMDQFWHQRLHPADLVRLNEASADCICGVTDGYSCDLRVLHKDGRWMWILSRAKVMSRTPDGRVEWIGGIHTDITEIKQVELNLRDMEAFLDRAGRIASVGAWQIDLRTRAVVFSAQTCAIHGLAADFQPTEEVALSFYPEADRQRLQQAMRSAEADGTPWDMVVQFHNAQGEQLWVRIFGEAGYDEAGPTRLVGAFQDVTKDHWAQQEVERSSALLRGAIETINEAFVLFDPQDRLVFCNDKYRAMYSKSADLMVEGASFESIRTRWDGSMPGLRSAWRRTHPATWPPNSA
jgi:PAS domain S-box-containing protein